MTERGLVVLPKSDEKYAIELVVEEVRVGVLEEQGGHGAPYVEGQGLQPLGGVIVD
eukprot:CAMPEP_0185749438 /NCGR_PEP_ID=MMETSP1174-20130828/8137_1 /TAXON_ID=35687 /ORGANISM="Dictyocha speculum, Strain CCMP1381" /LENGTH=55 /DNA_ID=CAMNT_0028425545 /DNA_START=91 /DNA_END=258 /DNA_ORIENTATION=-